MGLESIQGTPEYRLISNYYGRRRAARSGVLLMRHIDEGLAILLAINAGEEAMRAFCLHPLLQGDGELLEHYQLGFKDVSPLVLVLAMEYRNIANQYLSHREIQSISEIQLSPLPAVNQMLVADKVQNRKDFERYHKGSHPRSAALETYFANWLERLGVGEEKYRELAALAAKV